MKKLLSILFISGWALTANSQVHVYYETESALSEFEQALLTFEKMNYMSVRVSPPGDGPYIMEVTMTECRSGEFVSTPFMRFPCNGPEVLRFFARTEEDGRVRLGIIWKGAQNVRYQELPDDDRLPRTFIETYPEGYLAGTGNGNGRFFYSDLEMIPVLAYSPGIKIQMQYMGEKMDFVNYCMLRDKALDPALWYGEGVVNYVYYSVRITPAE